MPSVSSATSSLLIAEGGFRLVAIWACSFIADPSCEQLMRFYKRFGQSVDLRPGVVERKRRPAGRSHAEALEQRHRAMRAGADRDAGAVDQRRDVVRMRPLHGEGEDRSLARRGPD